VNKSAAANRERARGALSVMETSRHESLFGPAVSFVFNSSRVQSK
jgi:hypothetical protein